jgi:MFS family permease
MASSPPPAARVTPLVALQYRDFRLLWLGQIVSGAGTQMQFVAINFHIYELTDSPIALGLIGLFRVIPIIVFSLIGGVVADAVDRRKLMLVTQTSMLLVAVVLGALTISDQITPWMVYALTSLGATAVSFDNPARQSLAPNLVPRRHFANAVSLQSIGFQGAMIAGPALAGIVIERLGVGMAYWFNAVSFLGVLLALLLMRTRGMQAEPSARPVLSRDALREGLSFVFGHPLIRVTMLLDFIATFFGAANQLLPIFAKDILLVGAQGLGLLSAASGIGGALMSGFLSLVPRLRRQGPLLLVAVGLYGLATAVFGLSRHFWLSFAALALVGGADMISMVIRQTIRQLLTPDRLRGRMVSVNMIFVMGGPQLGELEAALLAAVIGAPASVALGGFACVAAVLAVAFTNRMLRAYDEEPPEDQLVTPSPASPGRVQAGQQPAGGGGE